MTQQQHRPIAGTTRSQRTTTVGAATMGNDDDPQEPQEPQEQEQEQHQHQQQQQPVWIDETDEIQEEPELELWSESPTTTASSATRPPFGVPQPWTGPAVGAALALCVGTAGSQLLYQHVSNAAPHYFFSIAILLPVSGLICYSFMLLVQGLSGHWFRDTNNNNNDPPRPFAPCSSLVSWCRRLRPAVPYSVGIGLCFAMHNLLSDFGKSGRHVGIPDVSTVLVLVLQKLVVPVSLMVESCWDQTWPTRHQVGGVVLVLWGIVATATSQMGSLHHHHHHHESNPQEDDMSGEDLEASFSSSSSSPLYGLKIVCLCVASIPLAVGYAVVRAARRRLPHISGLELWTLLCLPELCCSLVLVWIGSHHHHQQERNDGAAITTNHEIVQHVWQGMVCIVTGHMPSTTTPTTPTSETVANCRNAATYFWMGFPFSLALNLAMPILIPLQGSTSVPLVRAIALPVASLVAMTQVDPVIATDFDGTVVLGVVLCTLGLIVFYYPPGFPEPTNDWRRTTSESTPTVIVYTPVDTNSVDVEQST